MRAGVPVGEKVSQSALGVMVYEGFLKTVFKKSWKVDLQKSDRAYSVFAPE